MRTILVWFLLLLTFPARASDPTYFVSTTGNDANSCLSALQPCLTFNRVIAMVPFGTMTQIFLANGNYEQQFNISHYKYVQLYGNCSSPGGVTITAAANSSAVFGQDHATLQLFCLDLATNGANSSAIQSRQYAIIDFERLRFGYFPSGTLLWASETSRINCSGVNHLAAGHGGQSAAQMIYMHDHSVINMACQFIADAPYTFTHRLLMGDSMSLADFTSFSLGTGSQPILFGETKSWWLDNSELDGVANMPGASLGGDSTSFTVLH